MHQSVFKNLFAPLLLLAVMFGFALPASAAQTWRPTFSPSQHVYLDPALKGGNNPVNLDGLESSYAAESRKNGVEMYFIMTLKGDETTPGRDFAKTRIDEIMGNWGGQSGFPSDRAVVCYVVRLSTDWTKSAVACNVASELAKKGQTWQSVLAIADQYSQHRTANPDALLPQNPKGFALTVAQSVNQSVEAYAAQQVAAAQQAEADRQAGIARAESAKRMAHIAEVAVPVILVLIVLLVFFLRKRKAFNKASEVVAHWDEIFVAGNGNYIELEGHYLDFLKRQGDNWKDKFKGKTLTRYLAAITAYAELSARIKTAGNLLAEAKKLNTMGNIFSTAANEHAFELLTSLDVKIESKALSFEEQGLFGALVDGKNATKKPNELLDDMDGLFRTTNTTMADIMKSFEGAAKNKGEIDALFAEVEALKTSLTDSGLSFAAYQPVYDHIVADKANFLAIVDSDPLEAYEESQTVETACEALKVKIGKAIDLRKSLASTEKAIADAVSAVATVRAAGADYNYPDGGAPAAGASATSLFNEAGSNPDDDLSAAKGDLNNAIALVGAGQIEQSSKAKVSAEAHAAAAVDTIKKVVAAKEAVQKQVPVVHSALDKLVAEIPAGDQALASLNAGFLPRNFDTAPGAMTRAKAVQTATSGQLAAVKQAFFEQRYVAAAELVKAITGDIQGSRNGIVAVQTRLTELGQLRAHAKSQTAANAKTQAGLKGKLASNAFTTSASTDSIFAALAQPLAAQQSDVARDVTDWPQAAETADEMAHSLGTVDSTIDSEKAAYDNAVAVLGQLRAAVQAAVQQAGSDSNIVRQAAHNAVGQAQQVLGQDEANDHRRQVGLERPEPSFPDEHPGRRSCAKRSHRRQERLQRGGHCHQRCAEQHQLGGNQRLLDLQVDWRSMVGQLRFGRTRGLQLCSSGARTCCTAAQLAALRGRRA